MNKIVIVFGIGLLCSELAYSKNIRVSKNFTSKPQVQRSVKGSRGIRSAQVKKQDINTEDSYGGNRTDYLKIKDELCSGKNFQPFELWKQDIYDAQVQGGVLTMKEKSKLTPSDFEKISKRYATVNSHAGYFWARCPANKLVVLSTPAMYPLVKLSQVQYELSAESIGRCSKYSINYAPSDGDIKIINPSMKIGSKDTGKLFVNLDLLKVGTFSISCQNSKTDSSLLYLAPVKNGGQDIPLYAFLKSTIADVSSLVVWINNIRRKEGLSSIDFNKEDLTLITKSLLKDKRVEHDVKRLKEVKQYLLEKNLRFIGEDRVKAESFEKMMWLLWNSPTHRSLLLEKKATHGSILYDHQNTLVSIVLVEDQESYRVSKAKMHDQNRINRKLMRMSYE